MTAEDGQGPSAYPEAGILACEPRESSPSAQNRKGGQEQHNQSKPWQDAAGQGDAVRKQETRNSVPADDEQGDRP
jgi:hypothetical protein